MRLPFNEIEVSDNIVIREFNDETDPNEFMWHRDQENRKILIIGSTDWKIQLENELPRSLADEINIPAGKWHRLIKGRGKLTVKIKKEQ